MTTLILKEMQQLDEGTLMTRPRPLEPSSCSVVGGPTSVQLTPGTAMSWPRRPQEAHSSAP
jgi:hypothetical protein